MNIWGKIKKVFGSNVLHNHSEEENFSINSKVNNEESYDHKSDYVDAVVAMEEATLLKNEDIDLTMEKSRSLLKEATSLKNENIDLAIEKIKEANELGYGDSFKLSSYLLYAGRTNEAIAVYRDKIIPCEMQRELPYNSLGATYKKFSSIFYKSNMLEDYFYYSSLSAFFFITHNFTFHSDMELFKDLYKIRKPMWYTGQTNFERALKKINKPKTQDEYERIFMKLFDTLKEDIYDAAKMRCSYQTIITKEMQQKFVMFTEDVFNEYYKKNLYKLLF